MTPNNRYLKTRQAVETDSARKRQRCKPRCPGLKKELCKRE